MCPDLSNRVVLVSDLDARRAIGPRLACPICDAASDAFGVAPVLSSVEAVFRRCPSCFAVFAEDPHWLDQAYEEAIARRDIGLVQRNIELAGEIDLILTALRPQARRCLDFGAGNGMFVRMMRDRGFPFRYYDRHGPNLFAEGFEADVTPSIGYEVVTALEVVEHLPDPVEELRAFTHDAELLLVSTVLVPEHAPPLEQWWYYSLSSGQHITIFSRRSLAVFADRLGFQVTECGPVHVLSRTRVSSRRLQLARRFPGISQRRRRRTSLLESDYEELFGEGI